MKSFHLRRQRNHEVWNGCRAQVSVAGRATSGALAVTAEQGQLFFLFCTFSYLFFFYNIKYRKWEF